MRRGGRHSPTPLAIASRSLGLLEPSRIQLKDGRIVMFLHFADGRIALLHNACSEAGKMIPRNPLSIWKCDYELESWPIKEEILHDGWFA